MGQERPAESIASRPLPCPIWCFWTLGSVGLLTSQGIELTGVAARGSRKRYTMRRNVSASRQ
jgi:hypothetical protein